jgi:hypothetical protein
MKGSRREGIKEGRKEGKTSLVFAHAHGGEGHFSVNEELHVHAGHPTHTHTHTHTHPIDARHPLMAMSEEGRKEGRNIRGCVNE